MSNSGNKAHNYKVAIFGAIVSFVIPFIVDFFKNISFGTTITSAFLWFCNNVLNFKLSLWVFVLIFIGLLFVSEVYRKIRLNNKESEMKEQGKPSFLNYTADVFEGVIWSWEYNWQLGTYKVVELSPECSCGTKTELEDYWVDRARCPNCSKTFKSLKSIRDIELIIIDKIKKNKFSINEI